MDARVIICPCLPLLASTLSAFLFCFFFSGGPISPSRPAPLPRGKWGRSVPMAEQQRPPPHAPHPTTAKERDRRVRKERLKLVLRQLLGGGGDAGEGGGLLRPEGGRGRKVTMLLQHGLGWCRGDLKHMLALSLCLNKVSPLL